MSHQRSASVPKPACCTARESRKGLASAAIGLGADMTLSPRAVPAVKILTWEDPLADMLSEAAKGKKTMM